VGDSVVGWEKAVLDDTLVGVSVGRAVGFIVLEGGNTEGDNDEADMEGTGDPVGGFIFQPTTPDPLKLELLKPSTLVTTSAPSNTKLMIHGKIRTYNATDCAEDEF
jgi:hypothetical protein